MAEIKERILIQDSVGTPREFVRQEPITIGTIRRNTNGTDVEEISQIDERTAWQIKNDRSYYWRIRTIDLQYIDGSTVDNFQDGAPNPYTAIPNFDGIATTLRCNTLLYLSIVNNESELINNDIDAAKLSSTNAVTLATDSRQQARQLDFVTPNANDSFFRSRLIYEDSDRAGGGTISSAFTLPVVQSLSSTSSKRSELIPGNSRFTRLDTPFLVQGLEGFLVPNITNKNFEFLENLVISTLNDQNQARWAVGFDPYDQYIDDGLSAPGGTQYQLITIAKFHIDRYEAAYN